MIFSSFLNACTQFYIFLKKGSVQGSNTPERRTERIEPEPVVQVQGSTICPNRTEVQVRRSKKMALNRTEPNFDNTMCGGQYVAGPSLLVIFRFYGADLQISPRRFIHLIQYTGVSVQNYRDVCLHFSALYNIILSSCPAMPFLPQASSSNVGLAQQLNLYVMSQRCGQCCGSCGPPIGALSATLHSLF
jgi:hypothetical protein